MPAGRRARAATVCLGVGVVAALRLRGARRPPEPPAPEEPPPLPYGAGQDHSPYFVDDDGRVHVLN